MFVSETFPSWFIGRNPERRVIEVSYGDLLARRFGRLNKSKIEEFGAELFGIKIASENSSVINWGIENHGGQMVSAGFGGSITGQGADLLLIDDPIKNRKEADSQLFRDRLWDEYRNTLLTRLTPTARIIIILTRWHEDDLAGRILKEEGNNWSILNLPAIAEKDDLLGREEGKALWPEYGFDENYMTNIKVSIGSRAFNSLYQQRPSSIEGNLFKRDYFRYYSELPRLNQIIISLDCAFKDSSTSDYNAFLIIGRNRANFYALDLIKGRFDIIKTMQILRNLCIKYPTARTKLIETKANGDAVIQMLRKDIPGIVGFNPDVSKVARANAVIPYFEAGNFYLPEPTLNPWVEDYIEELVSFPNGVNDDCVDATTQALLYLSKSIRNIGDINMEVVEDFEHKGIWATGFLKSNNF